ncbi:hypothetical protein C8R44DRAFT_906281 [Mycena epipterygia]|nr:hypothetical protein C8R44DRAFT_906281 [Mycena epipterygia]
MTTLNFNHETGGVGGAAYRQPEFPGIEHFEFLTPFSEWERYKSSTDPQNVYPRSRKRGYLTLYLLKQKLFADMLLRPVGIKQRGEHGSIQTNPSRLPTVSILITMVFAESFTPVNECEWVTGTRSDGTTYKYRPYGECYNTGCKYSKLYVEPKKTQQTQQGGKGGKGGEGGVVALGADVKVWVVFEKPKGKIRVMQPLGEGEAANSSADD